MKSSKLLSFYSKDNFIVCDKTLLLKLSTANKEDSKAAMSLCRKKQVTSLVHIYNGINFFVGIFNSYTRAKTL